MVMLEISGLFWLAVSFWLYARCCLATTSSTRSSYALLGLAVFVTYLTRSSYGILFALALAVAFLFDGRWLSPRSSCRGRGNDPEERNLSARRRGQLWTALALGVPLALWF